MAAVWVAERSDSGALGTRYRALPGNGRELSGLLRNEPREQAGTGVAISWLYQAGRPGDAQVGPQKGDRLGSHPPAPIGVNVELAGGNLVLAESLSDEFPWLVRSFRVRHHPAGYVAAEDVSRPTWPPQQLGGV